ncbi:MAG TPA: hypothetical protein QF644_00360 [Candidatus Poseidoniaceae archaeon]|nr:hypothetical protein [Candidatus Poseidoniaceae archaeon]
MVDEHNFCAYHNGLNPPEIIILKHSVKVTGTADDPTDEHWIKYCGYTVTGTEPKDRFDALKKATYTKLLNRRGCCPNADEIISLGEPNSAERIEIIGSHLNRLIEFKQYASHKDVRINDMKQYLEWIQKEDLPVKNWLIDKYLE